MEDNYKAEKSQSTKKSPIIRTKMNDMEITILFAERDSEHNIKETITYMLTNAFENRITSDT